MENEPDDSIEIFGYEVDKDDALHASQAMVIGGALLRANANNKEKQQKAEIARREESRRKEIQQAADEKARQERIFDEANDPCPYCQTQISKQAALCPSCRNGFFGIPWGLINLALSKDPILVENLTAERMLNATATHRAEYEANLESEALQRRLDNERQIAENARLAIEQQAAAKRASDHMKENEIEWTRNKGKIAAVISGLLVLFALVNYSAAPLIWAAMSGYLSYYWQKEANRMSGVNPGHWSEKRGL
jgi:hypothetical protein